MRPKSVFPETGQFTQIEERTTGPLHTKLFALEKDRLKASFRQIEISRNLQVAGFRLGRCPLAHLFRRHHSVLEQELKNSLHRQIAAGHDGDLKQAVLPPEFTVHPWDGRSAIVIEARWVLHPQLPQPGGRFAGVMQSQEGQPPGAPSLPQPGPAGVQHAPRLPGQMLPTVPGPHQVSPATSPAAGASLPRTPTPATQTPEHAAVATGQGK
jgi:hypothetical protein